MPPISLQWWLLGQVLGPFREHRPVWGSRGPEKWGAMGTPRVERYQKNFLGLSKVLVGEPQASTYLLSTGLKCRKLLLKIRGPCGK